MSFPYFSRITVVAAKSVFLLLFYFISEKVIEMFKIFLFSLKIQPEKSQKVKENTFPQ